MTDRTEELSEAMRALLPDTERHKQVLGILLDALLTLDDADFHLVKRVWKQCKTLDKWDFILKFPPLALAAAADTIWEDGFEAGKAAAPGKIEITALAPGKIYMAFALADAKLADGREVNVSVRPDGNILVAIGEPARVYEVAIEKIIESVVEQDQIIREMLEAKDGS